MAHWFFLSHVTELARVYVTLIPINYLLISDKQVCFIGAEFSMSNVFKIVMKTLHWLPIEQRSIFRNCLTVVQVPTQWLSKVFCIFVPSVYKFSKHFGLSFAYDATKNL